MIDLEQLGAFYLGKGYDLAGKALTDELIMYDSRDLTTHAVCVGMTGSGKTGLGVDLLEEAALDNVPALIIDPKGDLTNLLLTFPDLAPADFRSWINPDDARRKGLSADDFAANQAELWRNGLASWGQDGARIARLRQAADFVIFTPGSDAGIPLSVLHSFEAPRLSWETDTDTLRERIQGTVSALLGLVGIQADPLRSREHVLLSNLFEYFWQQGQSLDMGRLLTALQSPPLKKIGVFDVDTFFPEKDRFELALQLNNIIAAPSFKTWTQGQTLDIPSLLTSPDGRPRHSIFYLAHLGDQERMFFMTMLLNQLITWMREQSGTTSLRALLYIDEVFGFMPPVANPPSKPLLLTLLKQARAFGLGTVLCTQNPVDLDYKGLSNAGTWFIGRLQTEQDRDRLLDGLAVVSNTAGEALDRRAMSEAISNLDKRVFLLHNVHEEQPIVFQTRWAMSYLRGPLTRPQVSMLMAGRSVEAPRATAARPAPTAAVTSSQVMAEQSPLLAEEVPGYSPSPPRLDSRIPQVYLPVQLSAGACETQVRQEHPEAAQVASRLTYEPYLVGKGSVHFVDAKREVNEVKDFVILAEAPGGMGSLDWDAAEQVDINPRDIADEPHEEALFADLGSAIDESTEITALRNDLTDHLYYNERYELFYSEQAALYSRPGETEDAFKLRLTQQARELRDDEVDKLRTRYETKLDALRERMSKAESTLATKEANAQSRKMETWVSAGESVVGLLLGRRSTRVASTVLSKQRQTSQAKLQAEKAEADIKTLQEDIAELEAELAEQIELIKTNWQQTAEQVATFEIKPRRTDVEVDLFGLGWVPFWRIVWLDARGAEHIALMRAQREA